MTCPRTYAALTQTDLKEQMGTHPSLTNQSEYALDRRFKIDTNWYLWRYTPVLVGNGKAVMI